MSKRIKRLEEIIAEFRKRNKLSDEHAKGKKRKNKNEKNQDSKNQDSKNQDRKDRSEKASIISDMIFYIALIMMVVLAFVFSGSDGSNIQLDGYRLFKVLTSSMESVYPRGSIILVKEIPSGGLNIGEDITFLRSDNNIITHRIIEIKEDYENSGQRGFVTKGVDNATADDEIVLENNVVGKVTKSFPKVGVILSWVSENILIILIFFMSLMGCSFFLKTFLKEKNKEKTKE